jgi:hypothetical protein
MKKRSGLLIKLSSRIIQGLVNPVISDVKINPQKFAFPCVISRSVHVYQRQQIRQVHPTSQKIKNEQHSWRITAHLQVYRRMEEEHASPSTPVPATLNFLWIRSILLTCTSYKGVLRAHKQHIKDITVCEFTWHSLQKRSISKALPTAISACSAKYILVHYDAQIIEKFNTIKNDTSQYVGKLNRMAQSWKSDRFTLNSLSYEELLIKNLNKKC